MKPFTVHHHIRAAACMIVCSAIMLAALGASAQTGISVAPTRLELDARNRTAELDVVNRGTETQTYRISLKHLKMTPEGQLVEVPRSEAGNIADDFVRFSPRQVVLAPGVAQKVRVLVRIPPGVDAGEYRSHLHFQALPNVDSVSEHAAQSHVLEMKLQVIGAVSIPLIVRHGQLDSSVRLTDAALRHDASGSSVSMRVHRTGAKSVYGDVEVRFTPHGRQKPIVLGVVRGVAVYPEVGERELTLSLNPPKGLVLRDGTLEITYFEKQSEGGKILAAVKIPVG